MNPLDPHNIQPLSTKHEMRDVERDRVQPWVLATVCAGVVVLGLLLTLWARQPASPASVKVKPISKRLFFVPPLPPTENPLGDILIEHTRPKPPISTSIIGCGLPDPAPLYLPSFKVDSLFFKALFDEKHDWEELLEENLTATGCPTDSLVPQINEFILVDQEPIPLNLNEIWSCLRIKPEYRNTNLIGRFVVRILVDEAGAYQKHEVITMAPFLEPLETCISQLVFTPAMQNGCPIKFWVNIPFSCINLL